MCAKGAKDIYGLNNNKQGSEAHLRGSTLAHAVVELLLWRFTERQRDTNLRISGTGYAVYGGAGVFHGPYA